MASRRHPLLRGDYPVDKPIDSSRRDSQNWKPRKQITREICDGKNRQLVSSSAFSISDLTLRTKNSAVSLKFVGQTLRENRNFAIGLDSADEAQIALPSRAAPSMWLTPCVIIHIRTDLSIDRLKSSKAMHAAAFWSYISSTALKTLSPSQMIERDDQIVLNSTVHGNAMFHALGLASAEIRKPALYTKPSWRLGLTRDSYREFLCADTMILGFTFAI